MNANRLSGVTPQEVRALGFPWMKLGGLAGYAFAAMHIWFGVSVLLTSPKEWGQVAYHLAFATVLFAAGKVINWISDQIRLKRLDSLRRNGHLPPKGGRG